ncbi:hypothetical protein CBS9595_001882 [Malassezia furfur]|nr:hypothetical protein CBS9595_001882 [Malassezia furfur]
MDAEAAPAPLVVKVMRMSAPVLATHAVPVFETARESGAAVPAASSVEPYDTANWDAVLESYARGSDAPLVHAAPTLRDVPYTGHLVLPSSFGVVGTVLVTVVNESDRRVDGVHLQVDIQRGSTETVPVREWTLAHAPAGEAGAPLAVRALEPRARLSAVVRHEIDLMAPHAVVCRVRYDRTDGAPEHWMTNARPVAVEDVDVVSDAWDVALLDAPDATSTARHLHPKDVRQWLLALTPRDPAALEAATLEQLGAAPPEKALVGVMHPLGTVQVRWRVPHGSAGTARLGPIARVINVPNAVALGDARLDARLAVRVTLEKPAHVEALVPCTCTVRVSLVDVHARDAAPPACRLALEPVAGTWTEVSLLGPAAIPVALDEAVPVPLVPLRGGVVRGGGMVLRLYEYAQAIDMDPPRVLREWPCFVELVAHEAP